MANIPVFVGHGFGSKDKDFANEVIAFLSKEEDIKIITGESTENKSVSQKVKEGIDKCELFVGLFTRKDIIKCEPKHFLEKFFNKSDVLPRYTTSSWVYQECGYAIGKGRKVMLLVEDDIAGFPLPGLQGDDEVIFFSRKNIDKLLLQINQMLNKIRMEGYELKGALQVSEQTGGAESVSGDKSDGGVPWIEVIDALRENEFEKAEKIYETKLKKSEQAVDQLFWESLFLNKRYCSGQASALTELKNKANATEAVIVFSQLVHCYTFGKQYDKALDSAKRAKQLAKTAKDKSVAIELVADVLSQAESPSAGIEYVLVELDLDASVRDQKDIYRCLIKLAKKNDDSYLRIICSEHLLALDPIDTSVRFDLAFLYSQMKEAELSLHHYKEHMKVKSAAIPHNNLGIQYNELDMPGKAVEAFKKSIKDKETLAMSNMAEQYIRAGFIDEGRKLLQDAERLSSEGIEVNSRVGHIKSWSDGVVKKEDEIEEEVLGLAEKIRRYRCKHSEKYFSGAGKSASELSGTFWRVGDWADNVEILIDPKKNEIKGRFNGKVKDGSPFFFPTILTGGQVGYDHQRYKKREVIISGVFHNCAGRYEIEVFDTQDTSGAKREKAYSKEGLFFISEDLKQIEVLEKREDKHIFETWIRNEANK